MSSKLSRAGLVGAALGAVAAGAAVGIAVERYTIGRSVRRLAASHDRGPADESGAFGSVRGTPTSVIADDGVTLYVEVDEPPGGADPELPTLVFCHGYALNQDSWHFQRAALRGTYRCVAWDQRGHGRSDRGRPDSATIDQLGRDLYAVLVATCQGHDVVLFGHSMGGMTVMALAERHPELFGTRRAASHPVGTEPEPRPGAIVGVALISTSAGKFADVTLGLPGLGARLLHRTAPGILGVLGRQATLVERGRRLSAELVYPLVKHYSFASVVTPSVARFTAQMIEATPIDVIADFFPEFSRHDKAAALSVLAQVPTLVMVGDRDLLTPPPHSQAIAEAITGAELVVVADAGHVVIMEHPDAVSDALDNLLKRVATSAIRPRRVGRVSDRSVGRRRGAGPHP